MCVQTKADNVFSMRVGERLLELCVSVEPCPGAFERSKLVILRSRYCILNSLDEAIFVRQEGTPDGQLASLSLDLFLRVQLGAR